MDSRIQEAHAQGFEVEASAQVVKRRAGLKRQPQAFDAGDKKLGAKPAEKLGAGSGGRGYDSASEHEVKVEVGFVKQVLEKFGGRHGVARGGRGHPNDRFHRDVAGETILEADSGNAVF